MKLTDLFIQRPVLASVVTLLIVVAGLRAIAALDVRQFPKTENTVITVSTRYPGASSEMIQGFITTPLQQAIAEASGIDYLTSASKQGESVIQAHMVLNYDPNAALAEIQAKVAGQRFLLPEEAEDPVIDAAADDKVALMYLVFHADAMSPQQITDYLLRSVQPRLQAVAGVGKANLLGNKRFAMRIWLDPQRMAAVDVTAKDVERVLKSNNYLTGAGKIKGQFMAVDLSATTDISRTNDFRDLVVRSDADTLVRIRDVARTDLGAEDYDTTTWYKGKPAIFIGIEQAPGANPLEVAQRIHDLMPEIRGQLPAGMNAHIPYDASEYIRASIDEVFRTLGEAMLIVLLIIVLSLGSLRAALIPAVTVPVSLIGACLLMLVMGFSINLLTLLAMVLAIGLVVDDAIVVVENIHRHIEEGLPRLEAALLGARELGLPIIAMTTTLIAVYLPIGFMGGLVGTLFTEFAFTLAGAVLISGVVALTLSPMLSSRLLLSQRETGRFERAVEHFFIRLTDAYRQRLHRSLDAWPVTLIFALVILISIYFMFVSSQSELAPTEDQSILFFQEVGPQTATLEYLETYTREVNAGFETIPEYLESFYLLGSPESNIVFGGFKMPPASQRQRTPLQVLPELQVMLNRITGLRIAAFPRPSLPGSGGGFPVRFVVTAPAAYKTIDRAAENLIGQAMASGRFAFLERSIEYNKPLITIRIDRDRAADLGISMRDVGLNLATLLGGNFVNRFNLDGRSYKVIPQVERPFRADAALLERYYVRTASGDLTPLSSIVSFEQGVEPSQRTQFNQVNEVTVRGVMAPGVTLGAALDTLQQLALTVLPDGFGWGYSGLSRQFMHQGTALVTTFFMSILVIYLVLAAQFESWRDPIIILVSVPMSIAGALLFITLGFASINIYTQVGLITLIGLIAKNGILMVEFANQLQRRTGVDKRAAIEQAAATRLRPILMTTVSMVVAMIPLLMASGPGAVSRFDIGLVIAAGLGIGTLFTLFVVPAVYLLLAKPLPHG